MTRLSKEQILNLLSKTKTELLRARVSRQPQLLIKPLSILCQLEQACHDVLPPDYYKQAYKDSLQTLQNILQQALQNPATHELGKVAGLIIDIIDDLHTVMQADANLSQVARKKIVFLPYKAAMWDSMESIWRAADADPDCDAYVVPIPYFERTAEGDLGQRHYEGKMLPPDVPIVNNENFDLAEEMPDVIYMHNPYDDGNRATSVDPRYYSFELRKHTPVLMYVPYYTTSGGMMESQGWCSSYENYDCIVIQAEFLRRFFSNFIPIWKIQALGSPKFDKVIRCCQNPPPIPEAWLAKMQGKKVYFYNTSLNGLLENTPRFLKKMRYVFDTFKRHPEVCLLWRPHPLMGDAMRSMRPWLYQDFLQLRDQYIQENWGIYDDTPDLEQTIALSDVYVSDSCSSVISLFGVAGKPLFLLKNWLNKLPEKNDWRGEILFSLNVFSEDWLVTENGNLYHAPNHDHHYKYVGHYSRWHSAHYWTQVLPIDGNAYVCPHYSREILKLDRAGNARHIPLEPFDGQPGAFIDAKSINDRYLFLLPFRYPSLVRYDTQTDKVSYLDGIEVNGNHVSIRDFFTVNENSIWHVGGRGVWRNFLIMARPLGNTILLIDAETMAVKLVNLPLNGGCVAITVHDDEIWLLPWYGGHVVCWEPLKEKIYEYDGLPLGFQAVDAVYGVETGQAPFSSVAFPDKRHALLAPHSGNMFVLIDRDNGQMTRWESPFDCNLSDMEGYNFTSFVGIFAPQTGYGKCRFFYSKGRRLYDIDFSAMTADEIPLTIEENDLSKQPAGFTELSEWLRYGCEESSFNTLEGLLNGEIYGVQYDSEKELAAYGEIAANIDGTAGEKIHEHSIKLLLGEVDKSQ